MHSYNMLEVIHGGPMKTDNYELLTILYIFHSLAYFARQTNAF